MAGLPVCSWYAGRVSGGGDDSMGLLALALATALIVLRRSGLRTDVFSNTAGVLLMAGFGIATFTAPPMIQAAFYIGGAGALLGLRARHAGIYGLLFLSLPVIASLQFYLGYPLRITAATGSGMLLKSFGFDLEVRGPALLWKGMSIMVDPPCAGLNMLWVTGFLFISLAAWKRFGIAMTLLYGLMAIACAVAANTLRVFLLFFKEAGIVNLPDWTHSGIGLLVFIPLVWLVLRFSKVSVCGESETFSPRRAAPAPVLLCVFVIALLSLFQSRFEAKQPTVSGTPAWPQKWKGEWLEPEPLPRREREFAKSLPGHIGNFRAGSRQVIIKQIHRPTRRLHPISHCLVATGYTVESLGKGKYTATRVGECLFIEETIYEKEIGSKKTWHDVSQWFWHASKNRTSGPWIAVVEITH